MGDTADLAAYTAAHIDDIPFEAGASPDTEWKPVRRFFDIALFGTNVARAIKAGDLLTHEHDEVEACHEELFLIVSGHATYRVNGAEIDAPGGHVPVRARSGRRARRGRS